MYTLNLVCNTFPHLAFASIYRSGNYIEAITIVIVITILIKYHKYPHYDPNYRATINYTDRARGLGYLQLAQVVRAHTLNFYTSATARSPLAPRIHDSECMQGPCTYSFHDPDNSGKWPHFICYSKYIFHILF